MAKKVNNTNKINKESKSTETARDKGVNSTDLLCKNKSENIEDDLIIGTYVKHNNKKFGVYVRLGIIGTDVYAQ